MIVTSLFYDLADVGKGNETKLLKNRRTKLCVDEMLRRRVNEKRIVFSIILHKITKYYVLM